MKPWLRFPPPLHVLVLLVVLTTSGLALLAKIQVVDIGKVEGVIESQSSKAQYRSESLAGLLQFRKNAGDDLILHSLSRLQTYPGVNWAVLCDPSGRIVYSSKDGWRGKLLSEAGPPEVHDLAVRVGRAQSSELLVSARESVTHAAATAGNEVVVAMVQMDTAESIRQLQSMMRSETWNIALVLVAYSLALWIVMLLFLRQRMRDFYRTTGLSHDGAARTISAAALAMQGGDEFAEISRVLGKAEHLLRDIGENLQEAVWILTPDLRTAYLSPAFEKIHMRSRQETYEDSGKMPDYILKEYHEMVGHAFMSVVNGTTSSLHLEYRIQRGDGQIRWIEVRGLPVKDSSGALQRIVGITRDITEQKTLQEELVDVSEKERHSLGHDLHDDACQRLAAMKLKSEALWMRLQHDQSPHVSMARELTAQISGTSAMLRAIARGLAPVEVEGDGLMLALQKLVLRQESIYEVPCFFDAKDTVTVHSKIVATHLYRIVQEFITNAARHGKPERIDVKVEVIADQVRLSVTNDGLTFQPPSAGHQGMGLKIVRYRAAAIRGIIDIRPRRDGITGTVAECIVSLDTCLVEPSNEKTVPPGAMPTGPRV